MLLHTPSYLLFLSIVVLIYWALPKTLWRKGFLIVCSYFFYFLFDWRFAVLLFALSVSVYLLGRAIALGRRARELAWLSVILNLGVLGVFKYANFFLEGLTSGFDRLGLEINSPGLLLLLPAGISFYTFQAIAYTVEIYRKKTEPAANFIDFTLYLVFFPKLIAGPLVRPSNFLEQLKAPPKSLNWQKLQSILGLLLLGLVKKILIADGLASLGETAFRAASYPGVSLSFNTPLFISGFYLYAFQIYCDFSGYTDLARASAKLMGFELPENFKQPYLATSLTSFWNSWHMTLTQWFREFLYFPFVRNLLKKTDRRHQRLIQTSANLMTMSLIGLWHGSAITFIAWGFWHGVLLSLEGLIRYQPSHRWQRVVMGMITFHLVGVGWVLFRADSFEAAWRFLAGLLAFKEMGWLPHYLPSILLTGGLVLAIDIVSRERLKIPAMVWEASRPILTIAALIAVISLTLIGLAHGSDARPFIYGQF